MFYSKEIEKVGSFVTVMYNSSESPKFPYHNLAHTQQVVLRATEIARYYNFDTLGIFTLQAAAWFHDVGHLFGYFENHEDVSISKMQSFMRLAALDEQVIDMIKRCILATKPGAEPELLIEQVMCDADTYHFGTAWFRKTNEFVKEELEMRKIKLPADWLAASLQLLKMHTYKTHYCRELLEEGKQDNIRWLQSMIHSKL
jgi:predicted metal-dependent HD superfamily phosphohydrolase